MDANTVGQLLQRLPYTADQISPGANLEQRMPGGAPPTPEQLATIKGLFGEAPPPSGGFLVGPGGRPPPQINPNAPGVPGSNPWGSFNQRFSAAPPNFPAQNPAMQQGLMNMGNAGQ